MSSEEYLTVEPSELRFITELRKQLTSYLQLSNNTNKYIAFKVKTTHLKKYCVRPNNGVVLPRSSCDISVTMQAQTEFPEDMQCKDKFLLQSAITISGNIDRSVFNQDSGYYIQEYKIRVVYVSPPRPPSPIAEGSEEDSLPSTPVSDDEKSTSSDLKSIPTQSSEITKNTSPQPSDSRSKSIEKLSSSGDKTDIRVVVVGDHGTGKSSLIHALVNEAFSQQVPHVLPTTRLPIDFYPDRIPVTIVDTSASLEERDKLWEELKLTDAVVLTYACDQQVTLDRLTAFWFPELRKHKVKVPVIVVGCKVDAKGATQISHEQIMSPIMQQFQEIETCIECSARHLVQVPEVFYYAQKAVIHPTAPLFDQETQTLKPLCLSALKQIFFHCDCDKDGALSDAELNDFQVKCFNAPLQPSEMEGVKRVVQERLAEGVNVNGLTLPGFLSLHALFIEKGRHETTWTVLRKFGYDNDVKLRDDFIPVSFKPAPDQITKNTSPQPSNSRSESIEKLLRDLATDKPRQFSHEDVINFTSNRSTELGTGAFGNVYKGQFNGVEIAVKVLVENEVVEEEFMAEVSTMGRTYHRNLVKLYGFCFDDNMKALVYEYASNGSLDHVLYENRFDLKWEKLYDIAVDTAKALVYLHDGCYHKIIHHDIKPANVLLDFNFSPKITDFGLAKLMSRNLSHLTMTRIRGTAGYAAPETWMPFSEVTYKCDVYSFGMMLFEILGRRRNVTKDAWFPKQVWARFESGHLDELIAECGITMENREKARILCMVALWCIQFTPEARPSMNTVSTMLEKEIRVTRPPNPFLPSLSVSSMQPSQSSQEIIYSDVSSSISSIGESIK